ncbi:hypothetical protein PFISCL1PPCAC_4495, partial [Pristionchus fissidentatus]
SFLSVAVAILMYVMSVGSFEDGVRASPEHFDTVLRNVQGFAEGAVDEINCSVDGGLKEISKKITTLPALVVEEIEKTQLMENLRKYDYTAIEASLAADKEKIDKIIESLKRAARLMGSNTGGSIQITAALTTYSFLQSQLPTATTGIQALGEKVAALRTTLSTTVNDNVGTLIDTANNKLPEMSRKVAEMTDNVKEEVSNAALKAQSYLDKFNTTLDNHEKLFDTAISGLHSIVILPGVVALFTATIAFLIGFCFVFKNKSLPSKGCCSASCTLITLSIFLLALVSVVIIAASLFMTVGYGARLVCQPLFHDEQLKALETIDSLLPKFSLQSMKPGISVSLSLSEVMKSCKNEEPFLRAVKGNELIDARMIEGAFDRDQLTHQLESAIDGVAIPEQDPAVLVKLTTALDLGIGYPLVQPLDEAEKVEAAQIRYIVEAMKKLSGSLKPTLGKCKELVESAKTFTDATAIEDMLKTTMTAFVDQIYGDLVSTVDTLTTTMLNNSASCLPIYRSYKDVGDIVCQEIAGGAQGMWAAAGLAALSLISTIVAVFCIASVLRS